MNRIALGELTPVQGGSHTTQMFVDGEGIFIQLPKCTLKNGIVHTKAKVYGDLLFTDGAVERVVTDWFESLEDRAIALLGEKRVEWFGGETSLLDIEESMGTNVRIHRGGKSFTIRANIGGATGMRIQYADPCSVYDVRGNVMSLDTVDCKVQIVPLVYAKCIRLANSNFNIDIQLSQILVVDNEERMISTGPVVSVEQDDDAEVQESDDPDENVAIVYTTDANDTNDTNDTNEPLINATVQSLANIEEIDIGISDIHESCAPIPLMEPIEVRRRMYKDAKRRAVAARKRAIEEIMRARDIKMEFMLDDDVDTDTDLDSDFDDTESLQSIVSVV